MIFIFELKLHYRNSSPTTIMFCITKFTSIIYESSKYYGRIRNEEPPPNFFMLQIWSRTEILKVVLDLFLSVSTEIDPFEISFFYKVVWNLFVCFFFFLSTKFNFVILSYNINFEEIIFYIFLTKCRCTFKINFSFFFFFLN